MAGANDARRDSRTVDAPLCRGGRRSGLHGLRPAANVDSRERRGQDAHGTRSGIARSTRGRSNESWEPVQRSCHRRETPIAHCRRGENAAGPGKATCSALERRLSRPDAYSRIDQVGAPGRLRSGPPFGYRRQYVVSDAAGNGPDRRRDGTAGCGRATADVDRRRAGGRPTCRIDGVAAARRRSHRHGAARSIPEDAGAAAFAHR